MPDPITRELVEEWLALPKYQQIGTPFPTVPLLEDWLKITAQLEEITRERDRTRNALGCFVHDTEKAIEAFSDDPA